MLLAGSGTSRQFRVWRVRLRAARALGLLLGATLYTTAALAGPGSGQVVAGKGDITQPNKTTTLITQQSDRLVIDWSSFNIAPNETVQFNQPSVSAAALNRILSQSPSQIFGSIIANGQVYLLNPNGIIFGKTASVNVGALFATGLNISNDDFMSGKLNFSAAPGQQGGAIINHGLLQAANGGSINLIGSRVFNDGLIVANLGQVNLAAGSAVTVDFDGDGLMRFAVSASDLHKMVDAQSGAVVTNAGQVLANGGSVVMTGAVAERVVMQAVNNSGLIQAQSIQSHDSRIFLTGNGGDVINSGSLDASSMSGNGGSVVLQSSAASELHGNGSINVASAAGRGGTAEILGNQVGLFDNAAVNASGATGGGTILVGGDAHGAGSVQLASATYTSSGAKLAADATRTGNGGQVVVWGTQANNFYGSISARGGALAGNGGWVETSAHTGLNVHGQVNASAPHGQAGTWLLDPYNVTIQTGGAVFSNPFIATSTSAIDPANIDTSLAGGTNVFVFTNTAGNGTDAGNITVNNSIIASGAGSLYLEAVGSILLNANIASNGTNPLNAYLWANYGGLATATGYTSNAACATCQVIVGDTANAGITTSGGLVDIRTGDVTHAGGAIQIGNGTNTGSINAGTGGMNLFGTGITEIGSSTIIQAAGAGAVAINAGAGAIALGNANTFTGAVTLTNSGNNTVNLNNGGNALTLGGASSVGSGTLTLSGVGISEAVGGTVTQAAGAGAVSINAGAGVIALGNANKFTGAATLINSGANIAILSNGANALTIGGGTSVGNNLTLTSGALSFGTTTVGGNLNATATGAITQTGAMTVTGTSSFNAGVNAITLGVANNFSSAVTLTNSGANAVSVNNGANSLMIANGTSVGNNLTLTSSALSFGTTAVGGNLSANTTGAITQTGALTVTGTSSFNTGANAITLVSANAFTGAVSLNNSGNNAVTLINNRATVLGASTVGGALSVTSNGAITQTGSLTVTGITTLAAGAANGITLNSPANVFTGAIGITSGKNVLLTNTLATALGASTISGTLGVTSNGAITQTGALTVTGATTLASGAANNITLNNAANAFTGAVGVTGGNNVTLSNNRATVLGASTVGGALTVQTNGALTQTGVLTVSGAASFQQNSGGGAAARNITLNAQVNNISGAVSFTAGAGTAINNLLWRNTNPAPGVLSLPANVTGNLTLVYNDAPVALPGISVSGALSVTANGAITQTGALTVTGATTLAAGVANNITLNTASNAFTGAITTTTGNNVLLTNNRATSLGASTISGTLGVTSNGAITQAGALTVAGTSNLGAGANAITLGSANSFTGAVSLNNSGNNAVTLVDSGALTLGASNLGSGSLTVTSTGIAQTGAIVRAAGAAGATFNGGAGVINLNNTGNSFTGAVSLNNSGNNAVTLVNSGALSLGVSTVGGALSVTSNGAITQSGALTAAGATSLKAGAANNITLNGAANAFTGGIAITSGNNVSLTNSIATVLGGGIVSGTLGVTSGGAITNTGNLAIAGASTFTVTTANADVLLNSPGNNFGAAVTITSGGGGSVRDVSLTNVNVAAAYPLMPVALRNLTIAFPNTVVALPLTTLSGNLAVTAGGAITQTGGLSVAGTTTLAAGAANNITLGTSNAFTGAIGIISGNNVLLTNNMATLLGNSTVSGTLGVISNGSITQGAGTSLTVNGAGQTSFNSGAAPISLTNAGNSFSGSVALTTAGSNQNAAISATTGVLTLSEPGGISIAGNLNATDSNGIVLGSNVTTAGSQTYSGAVSFGTSATLSAGGGASANISFSSTITGGANNLTFNVGAGGSLTQGGAFTDSGTVTLTGGAVTLTNAGNDFGTVVIANGSVTGNVQLTDQNSLTLGSVSLQGGSATITTGTGLVLNGPLSDTSGSSSASLMLNVDSTSSGVSADFSALTNASITGFGSGKITVNGSSSASDTLLGPNDIETWNLTGSDAGNLDSGIIAFTNFRNLTGGAGADTFNLNTGSLAGNINGGGGTNTLVGGNGANSWTVTGANTGTVTGVGGTFSNMQNLTGGTGNDDFLFSNGATVAGTVDGGAGGTNTLDFTAYGTAVGVTLTGSNSFGYSGTTAGVPNPTGGFAEITAIDLPALANVLNLNNVSSLVLINGSVNPSLFNLTMEQSGVPNLTFGNVSVVSGGTGAGVVNTLESNEATTNLWTITSANGGTYQDGQSLTFTNFADLNGGIGLSNNFVLAGGSVTSIVGVAGSNTLTGDNNGDTFTINAANGGSLAISGGATLVTTFSAIQNLVGGSANDRFAFQTGGSISGTVNGGGGTNTLDYSGDVGAVAVNLTNNSASLINGGGANGFSNIQALTGNGATTTLTGAAGSHTWTVSGADQGNIDGAFTFASVNNLVGGGTDSFKFTSAGSQETSITGSSSGATLDWSGYPNPVAVTLTGASSMGLNGTASGVTSFANIITLTGNAANAAASSITGANAVTGWNVTGVNAGSVTTGGQTATYSNFSQLHGTGNANTLTGDNSGDLFTLSAANAGTLDITNGSTLAATFTGMQNLTGGSGTDTFNLATGSLTGNVDGGLGTNTLIAGNGANSWTVTGANTGTVTGVGGTFSNMENLTGGTGNDDFVFSNGATISGTVDGGAGGVNTLDFTAYSTAVGVTLTGSNSFGYSGTTAGSQNPTGGFAEITVINLPTQVNTLNLNAASSTVLINSSVATNLFDLTVEQSGVPDLAFGNVSTVNGGGGTGVTNMLQSNEAPATSSTWTLTSANGGTYKNGQSLTFTNFADLVGGTSLTNNFILDGGSVASIVGGSGTNTLTGDNNGDTFTVSSASGGSLALTGGATLVTGFSGIQNLIGGGGNDTFAFTGNGSVSGNLNGGGGSNTLDYGGYGSSVTFDVSDASGATSGVGGTWSGVNTVIGSAGSDTIIGNNQTYTLTGVNAGNNGMVSWTSFEQIADSGTGTLTTSGQTDNLSGSNAGTVAVLLPGGFTGIGNLSDTTGIVNFGSAGSVTGNVTAKVLDYSGYGSSVTFDVSDAGGATTGIGGTWNGVNTVTGSANSDTITGSGLSYALSGANAGSSGAVSWTSFENLSDVTGAVNFGAIGSVSGNVTAKLLDYSGYGSAVSFDISDRSGATSGIGGAWSGVSTVTGSPNSDTIMGSGLSYALTGANAGSSGMVSWISFENLTDATGTVDFDAGGSIAGNVTTQTLDYGTLSTPVSVALTSISGGVGTGTATAIGGTFSGVSLVKGSSSASNQLTGPDQNNAWAITGTNSGTLDSMQFSGFGNLTGGTANDTFTFNNGETISGTVDGGASGTNTLDFTAYSTSVGVTLSGTNAYGYSGATAGSPNPIGGSFAEITQIKLPATVNTLNLNNGASTVLINSSAATNLFDLMVEQSGVPALTFNNVSTVNGGAGVTNTLRSNEVTNNTWTLTGANAGSYNDGQMLGFTNFADLNGGAASSNSFILAGGSVASLVGGSGTNALTGDNAGDTFTISGADRGSLAVSGGATLVTGYIGIQNLAGGSGNDTFAFNAGGGVSGTVNGGAGNNALDYSGLNVPVSITLAAVSGGVGSGSATGIGGGFANINVLKGSNNAGNQLIGPNQANTWNLAIADGGNVDGFQFTGIGNLTGGNSGNAFVLAGGSLSGGLNGGSGAAADNSLQGNDGPNTWNITGANQGTVTGIGGNFTNVGTLVGGNNADDFIFANDASLSGSLNGSSGGDTIDWSAYTSARNVTVTGPGSVDGMQGTEASIAGGFDNINSVVGASGTGGLLNTLTGPNSSNNWNVTASNAGSLDSALAFSSFQALTGGSGTDVFNLAAGVSGSINGGGGDDIASIAASFTAPAATLSLNKIGTITDNTGAVVTAGTLAISDAGGVGSASNPLLADLGALRIAGSSGNAYISTLGSVDLQGVDLDSGMLTLASGGSVTDNSGQNITAGTLKLAAATGLGTASAPLLISVANLSASVSGTGDMAVNNSGALALGATNTANGNISLNTAGALTVTGPVTSGGSGSVKFVTSSGDLIVSGAMAASGSGDILLTAAGDLDLDGSASSADGNLMLTGNGNVTGNSAVELHANLIQVTAAGGNINLAGGTAGAPAGTVLAAPGTISLQGFTTDRGPLSIENGGTFSVSGPLNLASDLQQTGTGGVLLASDVASAGNVQFDSPVAVATASVATDGGNVTFNQGISGSGTASLLLSSGPGNINLQGVSGLGRLGLQTSGVLSLAGDIAVNNLDATGLTGKVTVAGASVAVSTNNAALDFSHAAGINGLTAGGQSLLLDGGTGDVALPDVGATVPLAKLDVTGSTVTLASVNTTGAQVYNDNLGLGGNLVSSGAGGVTVNGNLALLADAAITTAGGGAIAFSGAVDGAHALALTAGSGGVRFGGAVGDGTPLATLTVNSATANLGSVTSSGTQNYQVGSSTFTGGLTSTGGAINFDGVLDVAGSSAIQADVIGFNGGAASLRGNAALSLLPETLGNSVSIGGGSGLVLNNAAMNGYNGALYIGTGPGTGVPDVIRVPILAGDINVNGSLALGSQGTLTLAGMGNLFLNSGMLSADTVTLIAGSQGSVMRSPGGQAGEINANQVILVSGGQIGQPGQELNIRTTGSTPQVQIATGAVQSYLVPPTLPTVIGPAAILANAIAAQLGLFIQANSQVTSIGQQIVALAQTGGLLESGFVDVSLFQNISLYNIAGPGITLPYDQCQLPNSQLCNQ